MDHGSSLVVKSFIDALGARDAALAQTFLHAEVEYDCVPQRDHAGITRGAEAVATRLKPLLEACEKVHFEINRQIAVDGTVFNDRIDRFWFKAGLLPSSNVLEWPTGGHWEVENGKIRLWRDFCEFDCVKPQLGIEITELGRIIGQFYGK